MAGPGWFLPRSDADWQAAKNSAGDVDGRRSRHWRPRAAGLWWSNKFDGTLDARIEGGKVRLITRNGHDWTGKMRALAAAVESLGLDSTWLDGEIVVMNAAGVPDFNALQNAIDSAAGADIDYFVFDLPFHAGRDLRKLGLRARRALLREIVEAKASDRIRLSQSFDAPPAQMLEAARQMGLEGILLKRGDAPYVSGRTETWLKMKCHARQELVVCGFTDRANAHGEVGSLLLGTTRARDQVRGHRRHRLERRTGRDCTPLVALRWTSRCSTPRRSSPGDGRGAWRAASAVVEPILVAEVSFAEWTPDDTRRQAGFTGPAPRQAGGAVTRVATAPQAGSPAKPGGAGFRRRPASR